MPRTPRLFEILQHGTYHRVHITIKDVRVGSTVRIRSGFGAGDEETVTLEDVLGDIKDGQPGVDYTDKRGDSRWAYLDQIVRVIKY